MDAIHDNHKLLATEQVQDGLCFGVVIREVCHRQTPVPARAAVPGPAAMAELGSVAAPFVVVAHAKNQARQFRFTANHAGYLGSSITDRFLSISHTSSLTMALISLPEPSTKDRSGV
jgi:hypothetical protein